MDIFAHSTQNPSEIVLASLCVVVLIIMAGVASSMLWHATHHPRSNAVYAAAAAADDEEMQQEQEVDDEKAWQHLMQTIAPQQHSWIVWMWLYMARFTFLVYNFTPMLLLAPLAYFNVFGIKRYWLSLMHGSFANGGSTFIKIGQWISMRSDLFPIEICDSLSELRLRAPSHSFEETCQVIRDAFGRDVDEIFDRFYIEPCASGSVAQIHKAQICINADESSNYFDDAKYSGNRSIFDWVWNTLVTQRHARTNKIVSPAYLEVAVKVRHPDILESMYLDISIMYFLSNVVSSIPGLQGLKFPIHQTDFTQYLESQIDLSFEGESLRKMRKNFARYNNDANEHTKNVIFPRVIDELCTSSVLVETWEYGVPLCNLDLEKLTPECRHSIAKQCYDVFMKMALRDNFVHGDCHSGNILIRALDVTQDGSNQTGLVSLLKDRTEGWYGQALPKEKVKRDIEGPLIFLDAGLTASLTKHGHERFGVMMGHIATAKCKEAAELFGSWALMDVEKDPQCFERQARFVTDLADIIESSLRWRYKDEHGNDIVSKGIPYISIGPLLRNVLVLTQREHITLDSSFSAVIASLGIIEGLIKTLDPSADFLQWGVPYLVKYRKLDALKYLMSNN
eukprot:CAMPEP_0202731918 /NCGR_PEP_ID=MMETSP1385-20130828/187392_1 /ASSEMBLY_ACC=CAM_ASM_000861 /TAXON_ID=933848 /ORGANISM="Elphidium margaritaceum" /LENGTH=621 /DNA_ID=CAMNT_0049398221 /DNA_START=178 /DNA_END=2044 /DNA_ORIENTATION=-